MRYVLITGAYGGMGRATVKLMRERGFTVFALDRRVDAPEEGIIPIETDITDMHSLSAAFDEIKSMTQELCGIIHLAGIYMLDSLVEIENERFSRIFDVNLRGVFLVNKQFIQLLKKNSRIVMVTSELAPLDPLPFTGIYAVSKAALDKYAYSLRMELQLLGIKVSVLRAGAVETSMLGVSTSELETFCEKTLLYKCNAERFMRIVNRVEARSVPPTKLAAKIGKIFSCRNPKFAYALNRNPLLRLLNILPKRIQLWCIRMVLR